MSSKFTTSTHSHNLLLSKPTDNNKQQMRDKHPYQNINPRSISITKTVAKQYAKVIISTDTHAGHSAMPGVIGDDGQTSIAGDMLDVDRRRS